MTGTCTTRQSRAEAARNSEAGILWPSACPSDQAMPALGVASAGAPASSITRALTASQAFTRTSGAPPRCSRWKVSARSCVMEVVIAPGTIATRPLLDLAILAAEVGAIRRA